jgi:8-hydroxy-5-deazaflavin:NADPH oxidoreductase
VIKAFNNIYAEHLLKLGKPKGTPGRIALPVAGNDDRAKAIVLRLIDELGFDGVDAGSLDESWRQQPTTPVYAKDFDSAGVKRALSEASKERKPEWRATENSPGQLRPSRLTAGEALVGPDSGPYSWSAISSATAHQP